jgi:hypothetical protein
MRDGDDALTRPYDGFGLIPSAPGGVDVAFTPVRLISLDRSALLVQGVWSRTVDPVEFEDWAAYCEIELRAISGGAYATVILDTEPKRRMFSLAWVAF